MFVPEVYVVGKKDFRNKNFKNFANCQKYIKDQIKVIKNILPDFYKIYKPLIYCASIGTMLLIINYLVN